MVARDRIELPTRGFSAINHLQRLPDPTPASPRHNYGTPKLSSSHSRHSGGCVDLQIFTSSRSKRYSDTNNGLSSRTALSRVDLPEFFGPTNAENPCLIFPKTPGDIPQLTPPISTLLHRKGAEVAHETLAGATYPATVWLAFARRALEESGGSHESSSLDWHCREFCIRCAGRDAG